MTLEAVLCCILTLHAQPISEQQAMERALQYMNSGKSSANARRMVAPALRGSKALTPAATEATKIYAFNMEGGGFVIASADQRTLPVLGYSTTGSIDWEQMPENMRSWLKQYDEAIATLGDRTDFEDGELTATPSYGQGAATAQPSRRAARVAVEPLITTHWDQGAPYWDQVPTYQGPEPSLRNEQCFAGCSYCCDNTYSFTVDNPTGIEEVKSEIGTGIVFDLQGRPLSGKPTRHGLYIQGNKKIFVR